MLPADEESFPRGGTRVSHSLKRPKPDDNLFAVDKKPKAKKARKESNKKTSGGVTEQGFLSGIKVGGTLSYSKIQEGLVTLGCIRRITNFSLELEFPGLTFGQIAITNISDPFTRFINEKLKEDDENYEPDMVLKNMFSIGQFVPVKIVLIKNNENGTKIEASINPKELNEARNHGSFKKNMLIWACVESNLDHGYALTTGVKNCRIFLPFKNVDSGVTYAVGQPLWCIVHKSESTNVATTLRVSAKKEHITANKLEEISSLNEVIPGMLVDFVTDKITDNGIQGKFLDKFFGYVNEAHLRNSLDTVDRYKEGKILKAYVLYIEPATKITHLTLRSLETSPEHEYKCGDIVTVEVLNKTQYGIFFKLPNNEKVFVTNKRIIKSLPKNVSNDLTEAINKKFAKDSKHKCRIFDYNYLSQMYTATVEEDLVKQNVFHPTDLKPGKLVNVKIEAVKPDGLVVSVGHVKGFVPNLHISNFQFTENIKRKYYVGLKVNARVLDVTEFGNILFTLKPGMVESEACLTTKENVDMAVKYPGVIVQTKQAGALIAFYGSIRGWMSKKHLTSDEQNSSVDPRKYFYRGEVVNVWILGEENDKFVVTLKEPSQNKNQTDAVKVGDFVTGVVSKITADKIDLRSSHGKTTGSIPMMHFSAVDLSATFLKTCKIGDKIKNLVCIDNSKYPIILSRREKIANLKRKKPLKKFEDLRKGNILRCCYESSCAKGIYVTPLTKNFNDKVLIPNKGNALSKLEQQQCVLAKIQQIDHTSKKLVLSTNVDTSVQYTIDLFSQYLTDLKYLREFGKSHAWPICEYQPGERIQCTVKNVANGGCLVTLPNGCNGLCPKPLCPSNLRTGQTLEGVFLAQNFVDQYVEVSLKKEINNKISKVQDGCTDDTKFSIAEKLLVKDSFMLAVSKHQLIYVPLKLNENDTKPDLTYYDGPKFKLQICGKIGNYVMGISKKLFLKAEKGKQKVEEIKSKRKKTVSESSDFSQNNEKSDEEAENTESENEEEENKPTQPESDEAETEDESESEFEEQNMDVDDDDESNSEEGSNKPEIQTKSSVGLPGISSFYNKITSGITADDSSSDEEEGNTEVKKKKKLSAAERAELQRQEEERIRQIEKRLADNNLTPESAEEFDRLLLANPNSSELWTKYIAFHISSTEIEKARTVGKRALEAIDKTMEKERFNIWVVLSNIEISYGDKESFEKLFEDAVKYNDSLQMYIAIINMLAEAGKYNEMEEKIRKVKNKHKQEPTMWLEIGKVYYKIKNLKEARNMMDASLKSIQDKKTRMSLIVRFAIMEFKLGEPDQGAAVFESILNSDPKKVNVWTTYVDQLVKKGLTDQARKVLERAVCQKLPLKSMKTLFMKFKMFEEQHGTPETLESVKTHFKNILSK